MRAAQGGAGDQPDQRVSRRFRARLAPLSIKVFSPLQISHVGRLRLGHGATTGRQDRAQDSGSASGARALPRPIDRRPSPSSATFLTPIKGTPHVRGAPWPYVPPRGGTRCARSSPLPPRRPHGPCPAHGARTPRPGRLSPLTAIFCRGLPRHRRGTGDGRHAPQVTHHRAPAISPCLRPRRESFPILPSSPIHENRRQPPLPRMAVTCPLFAALRSRLVGPMSHLPRRFPAGHTHLSHDEPGPIADLITYLPGDPVVHPHRLAHSLLTHPRPACRRTSTAARANCSWQNCPPSAHECGPAGRRAPDARASRDGAPPI